MRRIPLVLGVLVFLLLTPACQDDISTPQTPQEQVARPAFDLKAMGNFFPGLLPGPTVELKDYSKGWLGGDVARAEMLSVENSVGPTLEPTVLWAVLPAGASVVETKWIHIPQGTLPPSADIMFAFDLTGSMWEAHFNAMNNSINIMNGINVEMPGSRFGVMSHHDYPGFVADRVCEDCPYSPSWGWWVYGDPGGGESCEGAPPPPLMPNGECCEPALGVGTPEYPDDCWNQPDYAFRLNQPLTADPFEVKSAIDLLELGGGRDNPENNTRVMWEAYNDPVLTGSEGSGGWRDGVGKFLVYWLDHPPHDCDLTLNGQCGRWVDWPQTFPSTGPEPGRDGLMGTPESDEDNLELLPVLQGLKDENITLIPLWVGDRGANEDEFPWDGRLIKPRLRFWEFWQCYADIAGGRAFEIDGDGTFPGDDGEATVVAYIIDVLTKSFGQVELELGSNDPLYDGWVVTQTPLSVDINDSDFDGTMSLTIQVPVGTLPGFHDFQVCAMANGVPLACQDVHIVVPPPEGSVTGGGWIDSPAGAYVPDPAASGKATFGFVSKYKKGATIPDGSTEFQFHAVNLNFHSNTYDWLVVNQNDSNAQFKGTGTVNGIGDYKFMIWAGDKDPDTFRIKIWEEDVGGGEILLYDNLSHQPLGGGNIVIHTRKK